MLRVSIRLHLAFALFALAYLYFNKHSCSCALARCNFTAISDRLSKIMVSTTYEQCEQDSNRMKERGRE